MKLAILLLFCSLSVVMAPVTFNGNVTLKGSASFPIAAATYNPATDPNVTEWLRSDSIGLSDGDPIMTWTASVGGDATGANNGTQPIFKTGGLNSKPYIALASVDCTMTLNVASLSPPFAVTMVLRINAGYQDFTMPFHVGHTAISVEAGNFLCVLSDTAAKGASFTTATYYLLTWVQPDSTAANSLIYLNRVDSTATHADSGYNVSGNQLFRGDGTARIVGEFYELLIYASASKTSVETFLNTKYGGVF